MTPITLRIASCPECHSTRAVLPPADVGACPYAHLHVKEKARRSLSPWFWLGALAGFVWGTGR